MRSLGTVVLMLAAAGVASPARAGGRDVSVDTHPRQCTEAAVHELRFDSEVTVDEIQVELRSRGVVPRDGVAVVEVSAGRSARRIAVAQAGARALRFSPGLVGRTFRVALDPAFHAKTSACVERIVLLRQGRAIAVVLP